MWRVVWRQDCKELWRSRRLPVTGVLLAILVGLACAAGASWVRFQERAVGDVASADQEIHSAYVRESAAYLEREGAVGRGAPQDPVSVYWKRTFAWLPPKPAAALAVGQGDLHAYYAAFHGVARQVLHYGEEIQNPLHILIGKLDMTFVVMFLLPLLVIALAYDIVASERDAGRFALLKAQGASVWRLSLARLALRYAAFVLFLASCVTAALEVFLPEGALTNDTLQFLTVSAAYIACWFALAVLVNTTRASGPLCGLALIGVWALVVFLAPTLLHTATERRHPLPSRTQQVVAAAAFRADVHNSRSEHLARLLDERPDLRAPGDPARAGHAPDWYPAFIAYQVALEREAERDEAGFARVLDAREQTANRWRWLSPAIVVQRATQRIAGTRTQDLLAFAADVDDFRSAWLEHTRGFIFRNEYLRPEDFEAMPRFVPTEPSRRAASWPATLIDAGYLACVAMVLVGWSVRRLSGS